MVRPVYDLIIIGGGINGVGIAADAALRGLDVLLCEQGDLASGTSSASSKLVHGGLRYLEQFAFKLVKESLQERDILLNTAKHLVKPLNFILPNSSLTRKAVTVRLGLFLYDHLVHHSLPHAKTIKISDKFSTLLKPSFKWGFQYSDCRTNDSRLVIANALLAKNKGATILTYTKCIEAKRDHYWHVTLKNKYSNEIIVKTSRALINATGPWAIDFLHQHTPYQSKHELTLIKGSHLIVPRLYQEDSAFLLQNADGRVVFVIPYLDRYHLIGTTDVPIQQPGRAVISQQEIDYLLAAVNHYFAASLNTHDILHTFSGIRPLLKMSQQVPSAMSREYFIEIDGNLDTPPLLSVLGGKLTTYRRLAAKAIDQLSFLFKNLPNSSTATTYLPGSNYTNDDTLFSQLQNQFPWLEVSLLTRYMQQYGSETFSLLKNCHHISELGIDFGSQLFQREVDYLIKEEWAKTAEDILWRRTQLGLQFSTQQLTSLSNYIEKN